MTLNFRGAAIGALGLLAAADAHAAPQRAAIFDFEFANLSALPPTDADKDRITRLGEQLRRLLAESGRYEVVSTEPVRAEIAKAAWLRRCGGCTEDFAKRLGATLAITGEVQKVSNLILNINVYIKDVDGTKPEQPYSVDIRGDNDVSFDRGLRYLVKHRILGE